MPVFAPGAHHAMILIGPANLADDIVKGGIPMRDLNTNELGHIYGAGGGGRSGGSSCSKGKSKSKKSKSKCKRSKKSKSRKNSGRCW